MPSSGALGAAARVDLLHRQLMEFDVLCAMYPEDERTVQRCEMVSDPSAVRAAVEAWESAGEAPSAEELAALPAIKLALTVDVTMQPAGAAAAAASSTTSSASEATPSITLWATLPFAYPTVAPSLELSATHLPRDTTREVLRRLEALAAERTAALAHDGAECLMEVAQEMQAAAAEAAEAAKAAAAVAAAAASKRGDAVEAGDGEQDEGECHAVVRIDHMNDSAGYVKKLQKWATQLGLGARLFYTTPAAYRRDKGGGGGGGGGSRIGPPGGGRVEGVYVVLGGDGEAVQGFLTRLRTEVVDVDSKGNKCRERQSTVMCRRSAAQVKPGQEAVPAFDGFQCEEYGGADALEGLLGRFNLLHVGAGTQRFQPT